MESKSKTILLIDDDAHISHSIDDYLRLHGYDVVLAKSAEDALKSA